MRLFTKRTRQQQVKTAGPAIESLEPRAYFAVTPAPDIALTVTGPIPTAAISGKVINERLGINVANDGPSLAHGLVNIQYFASTTPTLSNDATQLINATRFLSIPSGRSHTLIYKIKEFPSNLQGNYYIIAEVTGAMDVAASSLSTIDIQPPQVNLIGTIIGAPFVARAGARVLVTLSITNTGNVIGRGPLSVEFLAAESQSGANPFTLATIATHMAILPGRHEVLRFRVPLAIGIPSGNEYLESIVDPGQVYASFSSTNVYQTPVSVT